MTHPIRSWILMLMLSISIPGLTFCQSAPSIQWGQIITVQPDTADQYGSQYGRLLKLKNGNWLSAYTVSDNPGYLKDKTGGLRLEVSISRDQCHSWEKVSRIKDLGRDLDNAQLIQLPNGNILLACRSVRWQESYLLPVYQSTDLGKNWKRLSTIDANEGKPGRLGKPDKGIYEPHFYLLNDGRLSVMYANEKHVTETPSYSQTISQKISSDQGTTWGKEIWVAYQPGHPASRPGMPVWTKMKNGKYIVVYEICGPEDCKVYYKISKDGVSWPEGLGSPIPDQLAAPYVLALKNGDLVVTSNNSNMSVSSDYGLSWKTVDKAWEKTTWPSLYEISDNEIGAVNSMNRKKGGHIISIRTGKLK